MQHKVTLTQDTPCAASPLSGHTVLASNDPCAASPQSGHTVLASNDPCAACPLPVRATRASANATLEGQIYDALFLIGSESSSLSANQIAEITGINRDKAATLLKEYVCAKLLGVNVKEVLKTVLDSYASCGVPLEYHFAVLVIQHLLDSEKVDHARFFLCVGGKFLHFINIYFHEIAEVTESKLRNKIELISQKYKQSFTYNTDNKGGELL